VNYTFKIISIGIELVFIVKYQETDRHGKFKMHLRTSVATFGESQ